MNRRTVSALLVLLICGCSRQPPTPDFLIPLPPDLTSLSAQDKATVGTAYEFCTKNLSHLPIKKEALVSRPCLVAWAPMSEALRNGVPRHLILFRSRALLPEEASCCIVQFFFTIPSGATDVQKMVSLHTVSLFLDEKGNKVFLVTDEPLYNEERE